MAGIALHIGINQVDKQLHHPLSIADLRFCHNDAIAMNSIAEKAGYQSFILLDKYATSDNILAAISTAILKLKAGDIFLLTYSSHGMQVLDKDDPQICQRAITELLPIWCKKYKV
jgi:hypothetical protein